MAAQWQLSHNLIPRCIPDMKSLKGSQAGEDPTNLFSALWPDSTPPASQRRAKHCYLHIYEAENDSEKSSAKIYIKSTHVMSSAVSVSELRCSRPASAASPAASSFVP